MGQQDQDWRTKGGRESSQAALESQFSSPGNTRMAISLSDAQPRTGKPVSKAGREVGGKESRLLLAFSYHASSTTINASLLPYF